MKLNMTNDTRQHLRSVLFGISAGCAAASLICSKTLRNIDKINEDMRRQHKLTMDIFLKIEAVMTDVTLSGSEKDKKVKELLLNFLNIVLEQDPPE